MYDRSCYVVNAMTDIADRTTAAPRRKRADGERTRSAILREAASLATVDGLEGLSIGNLAAALGMSKSGLYAHFGSKQELQLATVEEGGGSSPAPRWRWAPVQARSRRRSPASVR